MRWSRVDAHFFDSSPVVVSCCPGCQSAGGGDHSTEGAPSSAAEAQWEDSRETGLSGSFIWPHCTAAQVSFLEYGEGDEGCNIPEYILYKLFLQPDRFWKKAGYTPVYLRQTPVSIKKNSLKKKHFPILVYAVIIGVCVWLYLEWPDRGALLCDAEGAEYRWSSWAEPVAVCLLERWTCATFPALPVESWCVLNVV